jgi:hypothetical protein
MHRCTGDLMRVTPPRIAASCRVSVACLGQVSHAEDALLGRHAAALQTSSAHDTTCTSTLCALVLTRRLSLSSMDASLNACAKHATRRRGAARKTYTSARPFRMQMFVHGSHLPRSAFHPPGDAQGTRRQTRHCPFPSFTSSMAASTSSAVAAKTASAIREPHKLVLAWFV